jgi:hypothetical protein
MTEELCPWCHGVGGQWEVAVTKTRDIQLFENCRISLMTSRSTVIL